nr:RING-H2 finger protein ATL16 [Tanacetum cinerariifolium]
MTSEETFGYVLIGIVVWVVFCVCTGEPRNATRPRQPTQDIETRRIPQTRAATTTSVFHNLVTELRHVNLDEKALHSAVLPKTVKELIYEKNKFENHDCDLDCAICLEEFQEKETIRLVQPCNHLFHTDCIKDWLRLSRSCPRCRHPIPKSKEDEVHKISTSVFVTNFSDQSNAKDLWNACAQYGYVVDAFIPNRRAKAGGKRNNINDVRKDKGAIDTSNSYSYVVKGGSLVNGEVDNNPALVLDESCLKLQDYSRCLMGKVKDFGSLSNLKVVLGSEGFDNIDIRYLGGFWVMIKFLSEEVKKKFQSNVGTGELNGDIVRSNEDLEGDNDKDVIPDTVFEDNLPKSYDGEASKKENNEKISVTHDSLKYPPGFAPKEDVETTVEQSKKKNGSVREVGEEANRSDDMKSASERIISKEEGTESVCSGHFKKSETPRSGGSILSLMDELVKVGQTMGYNMDGCVKNIKEIIELQGANEVYR